MTPFNANMQDTTQQHEGQAKPGIISKLEALLNEAKIIASGGHEGGPQHKPAAGLAM